MLFQMQEKWLIIQELHHPSGTDCISKGGQCLLQITGFSWSAAISHFSSLHTSAPLLGMPDNQNVPTSWHFPFGWSALCVSLLLETGKGWMTILGFMVINWTRSYVKCSWRHLKCVWWTIYPTTSSTSAHWFSVQATSVTLIEPCSAYHWKALPLSTLGKHKNTIGIFISTLTY